MPDEGQHVIPSSAPLELRQINMCVCTEPNSIARPRAALRQLL
jgi:hypothetical protein